MLTHAQIFQHACRLCKPTKFLPGPQKPIDPRPLVSFSKETPRGKVKSCDCHPSTYYSDVNLGTPRLRSIDINPHSPYDDEP